ncbi:MAG: hypothetical protein GVY23_04760 [Spirochaetes bacterium]|nr:hypothetical protein [Spirochaetota bacterium]
MIIRCTQKVARKIKVELPDSSPESTESEWYTNLFRHRGEQFLVFTESTTLLSVVVRGRGITSKQSFLRSFEAAVDDYCRNRAMASVLGAEIAFRPNEAEFHKTNNRRILGSMNDLIYSAKVQLEMHERSLLDLSDRLNETPMSYLGYSNPMKQVVSLRRET